MRMVKALLDNQSLYLEKYLHELIPAVTTCIVSKQLCMRPDVDNHWALRDFASRLMSQICKNFNTSTNNIQTRVTRIFTNALQQGEKVPLSSLYGALQGLSELGTEVVRIFILPKIKSIGIRIETNLEASLMCNNIDKIASGHIKQLLVKVLAPILKSIRNLPDNMEEYKQEYGYFGIALYNAVIKARTQPNIVTTTGAPSMASSPIACTSSITRTLSTSSGIIQQSPTAGRTIVMNPSPRVQNQQGNQKFVFVTQRPQTPVGASHPNQPSTPTSQNTVVKFVSNANQTTQKLATQQKLVVVSSQMNQNSFTAQSSGIITPGNQPPATLISKSNFTIQQQHMQTQQLQQQQQQPSIDDLSHLA
ncbi:hypothetical protein NQ317_007983 [Molorchus minor]|uniref:TAF6 C-terminal HEAT repeat domain-containing protein n=1 Tax=Molorchus minor TaxID=1323400 RepID=A0ABQ9IWP9_9CUCU|nr:hypothetical protein NQ317_007983 [Molorchus minor]